MINEKLDPEVRAVLASVEAAGGPALEGIPVEEGRQVARDTLRSFQGEPAAVARVEDKKVPGPHGFVPVRVYTPEGEGARPALVYFHGGGWVLCDLDTHDGVCRAIAHNSGAIVIAVDYRLAPENQYPVAVEDCFAAVRWVHASAAEIGVDPDRIAVGGDSAGGNLAAVMSLKARDEGGPPLALQVLVYPVTNLVAFDTASYSEFAEGYYLTRSEMEWFRQSYLARAEDAQHPYASPLVADDLSNLPPALVITAEFDVLRDEGEAYAKRLEDAGVKVTCTRYPGMIHPFFSMPGAIAQGRKAIEQVASALRSLQPAAAVG